MNRRSFWNIPWLRCLLLVVVVIYGAPSHADPFTFRTSFGYPAQSGPTGLQIGLASTFNFYGPLALVTGSHLLIPRDTITNVVGVNYIHLELRVPRLGQHFALGGGIDRSYIRESGFQGRLGWEVYVLMPLLRLGSNKVWLMGGLLTQPVQGTGGLSLPETVSYIRLGMDVSYE